MTLAGAAALGANLPFGLAQPAPTTLPSVADLLAQALPTTRKGDMLYRKLGKTNEEISIIGVGGYHAGTATDAECTRIIRGSIDRGMTFLDNCWDYVDGQAETKMGAALRDGYRAKAFLMTKFDGRTKAAAARQIDESLKRLQTDHVDLLQFHENIRMDDPDRFFAAGGAVEALVEASVVTGIERFALVDQAIQAARTFKPWTPEEMATVLEKTRAVAATGLMEGFKTTAGFDGTTKNPAWMG